MPHDESNEKPLQSWKEIAAYLERDVRTARRWEKENGLPVLRHGEGKGSSVYAYPSEIEAWRTSRPTRTEAPPPVPLRKRPLAWAAAAVVAGAAAFIAYGPILNPKAPVAEAAEGSMRAEAVWTDAAASLSASLSPSGKLMTYTDWATGELWLRDLATGESRAISDDGPWESSDSYGETSVISPDGKHVAAAWYNREIQNYEGRVGPLPAAGKTDNGTAVFQTAKDQSGYVAAVGWLSNTRALFVHSVGFVSQVTRFTIADIERNETIPLKSFEWDFPIQTTISPDGRWIAYAHRKNPTDQTHDISILASDGSIERVVVDHPAGDVPVAWTPDGSHLLFRSVRTAGPSLWALPVADGKPAGAPRMISPEFSAVKTIGFSSAGELYYLKRTGGREIFEAQIDLATGKVVAQPRAIAVGFVSDNIDPLYSPDGQRLVYLSDRALDAAAGYGSRVIVVRDLMTGQERELSPGGLPVSEIAWNPDSESILFKARSREGLFAAYRFRVDGQEPEQLFRLPAREKGAPRNFGWSSDGNSIFYFDPIAGQNRAGTHLVRDLASGRERELLKSDRFSILWPSPDGKRFARFASDTEGSGLVLTTLDGGAVEERELIRLEIDYQRGLGHPSSAAWSPDGKAILFWRIPPGQKPSPAPEVSELWIMPADGGAVLKTELAVEDLARPNMTISLHPDGKRIVFAAGERKDEIWKLSNFLDRLAATD